MRPPTFVLVVVLMFLHAPGAAREVGAEEGPGLEPPPGGEPAEDLSEEERRQERQRALDLHTRAVRLYQQGAYAEALPLAREVVSICERVLGQDHPDVATVLNTLAGLLRSIGRPEAARPLFERALRIKEQALGPDDPRVATSLSNLAGVYLSTGEYDAARSLFERALDINVRALGPDSPAVAVVLNNLAMLLEATGRYVPSRDMHERALRIKLKALGPSHPSVATSLCNLAYVLRILEEYEQAQTLLERALQIRGQTLGAEHPDVGSVFFQMADLLLVMRQAEESLALYERALSVYERALGPHHPSVARCLYGLAAPLCAMGHHHRAGPYLERCIRIVEEHLRRHFVGLEGPERLAQAHTLRGFVDEWLRISPLLGRSGYAEVLRFKGLVARATAAERALEREAGPEAAVRIERFRAADRKLSRLANSMPPVFQRNKHQAWQEAYANAGLVRDAIASELSAEFAPLRKGLERLDLTSKDVQRELGPDAVLVDILRSGSRYLAWIVRAEGKPERVDLGRAESIEQSAQAFVEQIGAADPDTLDDAWQGAGRALADLVIAPVEERLAKKPHTLYLCPDAVLAAVPFAALPREQIGTSLIDDYLLVQVSMAQDLVPWVGDTARSRGTVAVGAVDYEDAVSSPSRTFVAPSPSLAVVDRAARGRSFVALPQTRTEVEFLKSRLREECVLLLEQNATEARFRSASRGKRILHLATHGFVREDLLRVLRRRLERDHAWLGADVERQLTTGNDPMLLAGLAFAGANARDGAHGDDGILTAAEASHLDLDGVDLVVLSACETALGRAEAGEGVIGLVRGFQLAGAKRVIASLWQVDDEATRLLMQHLYAGLGRKENPLTPAQALRAASQAVRGATGARGRSFAHPRYWAAFAAYGR